MSLASVTDKVASFRGIETQVSQTPESWARDHGGVIKFHKTSTQAMFYGCDQVSEFMELLKKKGYSLSRNSLTSVHYWKDPVGV